MPQNKDFVVRNGFSAAGGSLQANSSSFSFGVGGTFGAQVQFGGGAGFNGYSQFNTGLGVIGGLSADTISVTGLTVNGAPYVAGGGSSGGGSFTAPQTYTPGSTTLTNASNLSVFNVSVASGAVTLPSTSGLSQGWNILVRFTSTAVNSYQALRIASASAGAILFDGTSLTNLYTLGRGETFHIIYLGGQFWVRLFQQASPITSSSVNALVYSGDNVFYSIGGGRNFVAQSISQNGGYQISSGGIQVPVTGLYGLTIKAYAAISGTSTITPNIAINGNNTYQQPMLGGDEVIGTGDQNFVTGYAALRLNQGDVFNMWLQSSNAGSASYQPSNTELLAAFLGR